MRLRTFARFGLPLLCLLLLPQQAWAQLGSVPYTFTSGSTISSTQVNANFSDIYSKALLRTGGTMTGTLQVRDVTPAVDNTYDLGTNAASFNDGWFDGTLTAVTVSGTTYEGSVVRASDRVSISGETTAGVRLKVTGGALYVREGDDSDYGPLSAGLITATGGVVADIANAFAAYTTANSVVDYLVLRNGSNGTGAGTRLGFGSDTTGAGGGTLTMYGSGFTTSGAARGDSFRANSTRPGGIVLSAVDSNADIRVYAGGDTDADLAVWIQDDLSTTLYGSLTVPTLASSSGTRYICSSTTGLFSASASACSGTDADLIASIPALQAEVAQLRAELAAARRQ